MNKSFAILITSILFMLFPIFSYGLKPNPKLQNRTSDYNVILPPAWAFGVLYGGYTNQSQTIKRIDEIVAHDYPIDAYWIDSWFWSFDNKGSGPAKYIDFVADTVGFPNRKAMWDYMEQRKIKGGFWIWDCIFETGNESTFRDFDEKRFFRNKYVENNPWHNYSTTTAMFQTEGELKGTLCGNIDFNNFEAITYFKQKMKPFFDEGADFLKLDRTSAIEVCKSMFEISQEFGRETRGRGFILSHTGGQESEEYKRYPAKWTDDTRSDWDIEQPTKDFNFWVPAVALKENIAMFTDSEKRSSAIPFLANDLGGFDMGKTEKPDEELYMRWLQFSMFTPVVEVFSQPENPTSNMAYLVSERADKLFRKYSHLRMELFPYIYSYAHKVRLEGKQMMQAIYHNPFNYMFGNELFVAPVYKQGSTKWLVELPAGKWLNYWTNDKLEGARKIEVNAPLDQIPLFVHEGSIIPMRKYASSIEKGTNDTLIVHIYPGEKSEFKLIEDDGLSNDYLIGKIACTYMKLQSAKNNYIFTIKPVVGSYEKMKNVRVVKLVVHDSFNRVRKITHNGDKVSFEYIKNEYETIYFQINKNRTNTFIIYYR